MINAINTDIDYQGRKSNRTDGKEKRIKLLEATLKIIIRDGMRGVRHRAIAVEAEVSLSSTTYYFKDIHDLITDAFLYFADQELIEIKKLESLSHEALKKYKITTRVDEDRNLSSVLSVLLFEHIKNQVADSDRRRLEYAFQNEALHNNKLALKFIKTQAYYLKMIEQFFISIGSEKPLSNAQLTLACIRSLEYQLVVNNELNIDEPFISETIEQLVDRLSLKT